MATLILDLDLEKRIRDEHPESRTECWDGVEVMASPANNEHQRLVMRLAEICSSLLDWDRGEASLPGANLSDRVEDWESNYRCPDVLVYLKGNPAVEHVTHWVGGPDFLVEILSNGENPTAKFDFYSSVQALEILIVERFPWALELFQLRDGQYVSTGRTRVGSSVALTVQALGLTFQLKPGSKRPLIEVQHLASGKKWRV